MITNVRRRRIEIFPFGMDASRTSVARLLALSQAPFFFLSFFFREAPSWVM